MDDKFPLDSVDLDGNPARSDRCSNGVGGGIVIPFLVVIGGWI